MGEKKAELRSAHPLNQSCQCPWGGHTWNSRMLVLPGEHMQSTICLSSAGGSGSLAIIYYELCSKKVPIELCNSESWGKFRQWVWFRMFGTKRTETEGWKDSKHANMTGCCRCRWSVRVLQETSAKSGAGLYEVTFSFKRYLPNWRERNEELFSKQGFSREGKEFWVRCFAWETKTLSYFLSGLRYYN